MDFTAFPKIGRLAQHVTITEKIHGTNAQVLVKHHADGATSVFAGSRTRWITPADDNFGFAGWVHANASDLIALLGEGQHFGEWYGRGINAGYGLKQKRFALFNTARWAPIADQLAPVGVDVVPVLYVGPYTSTVVDETLSALKASGSALVPGFPKPVGVVVRFDQSGVLFKRTFESEDEEWHYRKESAGNSNKQDRSAVDMLCAPFWQPARLEKLLSRDEAYGRDYPRSLPDLCRDYLADLVAETPGVEDGTWKVVRRNAFPAIKGMMGERGF